MPTSDPNSNVSQIITALTAHVSPIGTPAGVAGLTEWTSSSLAAGKNLQALLPPSLRAACRSRSIGHRMGEYGYEPLDDGFELVGSVVPVELEEGRIIVEAALRPSDEATVARELTRLRFATASRDITSADMAIISAVYAEALAEYPGDIVTSVCRGWVKGGGRFWPSLGELTEPADGLLKERRDLAEALARGPRRPPEPGPEDEERRRRIAEQEQRYIDAEAWRNAHPELLETGGRPPPRAAHLTKHLPPLPPYQGLADPDDPAVKRWYEMPEIGFAGGEALDGGD